MNTELFNRKIREVLAFHVTSTCNLACSECIMQWQMNNNFAYHMSIEEVKDFIKYTKLSNYSFKRLTISGGEPFLWKNLEEGLALLKDSGITEEITVFTNAVFYKKLTPKIIKNINTIRVSYYDHLPGGIDNAQSIEQLKLIHPNVIVVPRDKFYPLPESPLENTQPVECMNIYAEYYDGKILACAHAHSLALKRNINIETGIPICINYLDKIRDIRNGYHKEICSICISNKKVRNQVAQAKNKNSSRAESIKISKQIHTELLNREKSIGEQKLL